MYVVWYDGFGAPNLARNPKDPKTIEVSKKEAEPMAKQLLKEGATKVEFWEKAKSDLEGAPDTLIKTIHPK